MLTFRNKLRGFSLAEALVVLVIVALLVSVATPNVMSMIQNAKIRTTSESILDGLQLARAESVKRNSTVRFQLMSDLTTNCAPSQNNSDWVISQDDATGSCQQAPTADSALPVAPRIIQKRSSAEGSTNLTIVATQSPVAFNGLGRQISVANLNGGATPNPPVGVTIDISNPAAGQCMPAGPMKCMRITISAGGQIRMCNPALPANTPQGC